MTKIRIHDLKKEYKETIALEDFEFESKENEFITIVGPSGCGKTTLLRLISGLEESTSGKIFLNDEDITNLPPEERDIAMVFQSYALYPNLTVYNNLAFPLKMRNVSKNEIDQKVRNIAHRLELDSLLDRKPLTLSGGQKQRVAIGRALIRNPKMFLFDEPLSNLDASLREKMRAEIISLHNEIGGLFLYVTHDQTEAMAMGDRIIVLNNGHVQQIDTPSNIYNHPANLFVAKFIGVPHMNFIDFDTYKYLCKKNSSLTKKYIGIRPEHIEITDFTNDSSEFAVIQFCEMLGKEICYHVKYRNTEFCVLSSSNKRIYKNGEKVSCLANKDKFVMFDE